MEDDIVLSVRNVSKCFEMYEKPVHRLYQTLFAGHRKFYKEFWALKDISFDVHRGECVGIIGRNGAGKSTLLQIITGTLAPTTGEVKMKGRVAALLELGSGFNPEFTGRENVYLNAAILGLTKAETDARFQGILDFADIGEFIDQPVKTYSSGMMVRLAFAVNVFVDPEILIVDEALAVGDAAFQLKCANRMKELLARKTTVLFVSHDTNAVRTFCNRAVWINNGVIASVGDVRDVTAAFLEEMFSGRVSRKIPATKADISVETENSDFVSVEQALAKERTAKRWGTGEVMIESFTFSGMAFLEYGENARLKMRIRVVRDSALEGLAAAFSIRNKKGLDVVCCRSLDEGVVLPGLVARGQAFEIAFEWRNELKADDYALMLAVENVGKGGNRYCDYVENAAIFKTGELSPIFALTRPACRISVGETKR